MMIRLECSELRSFGALVEPCSPTICSIKNETASGPELGSQIVAAPVRSLNEIVAGIRNDRSPTFHSCESSDFFFYQLLGRWPNLQLFTYTIGGGSFFGLLLTAGLLKLGIHSEFLETLSYVLSFSTWVSVMIYWGRRHDCDWQNLPVLPRIVRISYTTCRQLEKDWEAAIHLAMELDHLYSLLSQIGDPEMMALWQRKKQELGGLLEKMDVVFKKATPTRFFPYPEVVVVYDASTDTDIKDGEIALRWGFYMSRALRVFLEQLPDTISQENLTPLRGRTHVRIEPAPEDNLQLAEADVFQENNSSRRDVKKG